MLTTERRRAAALPLVFVLLAAAAPAATTYEVGPTKPFASLQAVAPLLAPGDLVLVDGNVLYPGGVVLDRAGTPAAKITIRGVRVNGNRPILTGGVNTIEFRANHYVFEGFEVAAGSFRGIYHHAHDVTIRDCLVRDCPAHGIVGADSDSGSLLLEYTEVRNCGNGTTQHQIYMATDNTNYPNAVFRMQHCYVHHGKGGNNVKSRAGRNEIYYNWIEGAFFHELELIGADGQTPSLVREDSDVVGNVLRKTDSQGTFVTRIGGDGTGTSNGRHRFAHNTILLSPNTTAAVFRLFDALESFEAHGNVIYRIGGGGVSLLSTSGLSVPFESVAISGSNNWIASGSTGAPAAWTGTTFGTDPGFANVAALDVSIAAGSPLENAGSASTPSPAGFPFPSPLPRPLFHPRQSAVGAPGTAAARPVVGAPDVGAFEVPTSALAGTPDDLELETRVNGLGIPGAPLKVAFAGDAVQVRFLSPGGALVGAIPLLAGQAFVTGAPPAGPPGFPAIHVDPLSCFSLYDAGSAPPPYTGVLPPGGAEVQIPVLASFAGLSARFQALAISTAAADGFLAATEPHDVMFEAAP